MTALLCRLDDGEYGVGFGESTIGFGSGEELEPMLDPNPEDLPEISFFCSIRSLFADSEIPGGLPSRMGTFLVFPAGFGIRSLFASANLLKLSAKN